MKISVEEYKKNLAEKQGRCLQKKLFGSVVAVCGLGGLGSHIAMSLARAGIGRLILVDFDEVDASNINRQQYKISQTGMKKTQAIKENISEVSPFTVADTVCARICKANAAQILKDADIVIEAFDDAKEKSMLADIVLCGHPEKYYIASSGMAGIGAADSIKTKKINEKFYVCGDGVSGVDEKTCLFAPRVELCAAHQALCAIKILSEQGEKNEK